MNDGEIELAIRASVRVTRQHLIAAKANILSDFSSSVTSAVQTIYADQVIFASMSQASGIKPLDLKGVTVWSDAVRDSRNTIHFGVASAIPNTYEKVAALLIGAVPHIRLLYLLKGAADAVVV